MKRRPRFIFIFGTRPEIIKLAPLIKLCQKRRVFFKMIHSGQHYSYDMDRVFFRDLQLPLPNYSLRIKSKAPYMQGNHTGRMLIEIEEILLEELPFAVIVQGDTNTALAGALCAEKISTTRDYTGFQINVAHVEAGLRSWDRSMPEEVNRFLVDHLSDFLFVPTALEKKIVTKEGVPASHIYVTGNTIVDAVQAHIKLSQRRRGLLEHLGIEQSRYALLTLHRQENVDSPLRFRSILQGIVLVAKRLKMPIIFPIHPRTVKALERFGIKPPRPIKMITPLDFLSFLYLESYASLILTDSGGVQEEACILKVPCVTLRENTERPQTVKVGSNIVGGVRPQNILAAAMEMVDKRRVWRNPFGDGKASQKMFDILWKASRG